MGVNFKKTFQNWDILKSCKFLLKLVNKVLIIFKIVGNFEYLQLNTRVDKNLIT